MTKHITTKFGFQRLEINSNFNIWTCKISIKHLSIPIIAGVNVSMFERVNKSGSITNMLMLKYCTMDWSEHDRMQREIMLFLEEHAIKMTKKKYGWLHEREKELEMPAEELLPSW